MAPKRNVFGIRPTVFGKILIFQLLPGLLKDSGERERAFVLVVTPLVSIMKEEVEELTRFGLRVFEIGLRDEKGEKNWSPVYSTCFSCVEVRKRCLQNSGQIPRCKQCLGFSTSVAKTT